MRISSSLWLVAALLGCAEQANLSPELGQLPPPTATLDVPAGLPVGTTSLQLLVSGTLGEGEAVYLGGTMAGLGAGPCIASLGGICLDIVRPRQVGSGLTDVDGQVVFDLTLPAVLAVGDELCFQALVARGINGANSIASEASCAILEAPVLGCTDPTATNYDPAATVEDGSCLTCVGSSGAYEPAADETLSGSYVFDSILIPAGVTITGAGAAPLDIEVCGDVVINGALDVSGADGVSGTAANGNPSGGFGGAGGVGTCGGGTGGVGGDSFNSSGALGVGTGRGSGGGALINVQPFGTFYDGGNGGGAGYASAGGRGFTAAFTGTGGGGGSTWGDAQLSGWPAVGGSGGGGGSGGLGGASTGYGGSGGGAGGGAIHISAGGTITVGVDGAVLADGGVGGRCQNTGAWAGGGAGSGGAIWLSAASVVNDGLVSAVGGTNCFLNGGAAPDGKGGDGRIRVDVPSGVTPPGTFDPVVGFVGTP